jgi:predicted nucleic acid-binding protein
VRSCVLDASVVVKWFLDEVGSKAARALQSTHLEMAAPQFLVLELANVLWKHVRKGALDVAAGSKILSTLEEAPIQWQEDAPLFHDAFLLAADTGRTAYDCLYLALARRRGSPLITADRKFFEAISSGPLAEHILWIESVPDVSRLSRWRAMQRFADELRWAITHRPHQWFCFRKVWKTDPEVSPGRLLP